MKSILLTFVLLIIGFNTKSQTNKSKLYEGFDSAVVRKLNYMLDAEPYIQCQTFDKFFSLYQELETSSQLIMLSYEDLNKLIFLIKKAHPYQTKEKSMNIVDVRAKIVLFKQDGKSDTLCYGHNFERCFVYNGVIMQLEDENLYYRLKKIIWKN